MLKKRISLILAAVLLAVAAVSLVGCGARKVEGKVWTYYVLQNGKVALVGLNPDAVPEDGVLYIPNKVDGRKVSGFGVITSSGIGGTYGDMFSIPHMEKLIVADGVPINNGFWDAGRIIELESKTAENIYFTASQNNIIVPDGCRETYLTAMEAQQSGRSRYYCVLEKSEAEGLEWLIDEDGLLKGYFGLESQHLVLPSGIKKIDDNSIIGGGGIWPETIVLNEDLEEIADYGLNFRPSYHALDEITIPKSVQYLGKRSISTRKIYLYRSTVCHEDMLYGKEVVYLD